MLEPPRLRRTSIAIIVLASVVAFFAVFAVWAKRQILETDTWTETSTQVLEDHDVQEALNTFLVDALFKQVNVEHRLKKALPDNLQGLAGPATGGIHELALVPRSRRFRARPSRTSGRRRTRRPTTRSCRSSRAATRRSPPRAGW